MMQLSQPHYRQLVATALWLLLVLASPGARAELELTLPESMRVTVVTPGLRMNGLHTRIYAFTSPDSAQVLTAWFSDQWDGRIKRRLVKPWSILAHRAGGLLVTVQMQDAPVAGTQGYIGISNAFEALAEGLEPPQPGVPMLPDTQVLNVLEANDGGRESRTVVLLSEQSVHQNLEFYRAYFRRQGYSPVSYGALSKEETAGAMILSRGAQRLDVAVTRAGGKTMITLVFVDY